MLNTAPNAGAGMIRAMVKRLPTPPHSRILDGFGPRLRDARKALGFKAADFARLIGATPQRLANWEAGTNPPEAHMLAAIHHAGISVDYLLTGSMTGLSARLLQGLLNMSAGTGEHTPADEARAILRELPDEPTTAPAPRRLHERQTTAPRRFLRPPDIQQG